MLWYLHFMSERHLINTTAEPGSHPIGLPRPLYSRKIGAISHWCRLNFATPSDKILKRLLVAQEKSTLSGLTWRDSDIARKWLLYSLSFFFAFIRKDLFTLSESEHQSDAKNALLVISMVDSQNGAINETFGEPEIFFTFISLGNHAHSVVFVIQW